LSDIIDNIARVAILCLTGKFQMQAILVCLIAGRDWSSVDY